MNLNLNTSNLGNITPKENENPVNEDASAKKNDTYYSSNLNKNSNFPSIKSFLFQKLKKPNIFQHFFLIKKK